MTNADMTRITAQHCPTCGHQTAIAHLKHRRCPHYGRGIVVAQGFEGENTLTGFVTVSWLDSRGKERIVDYRSAKDLIVKEYK